MNPLCPVKLSPSFRPKIWGRWDLRPWFPVEKSRSAAIGEVWYSFEENLIASGPFAGLTVTDLIEKFGARLMGPNYQPRSIQRQSTSDEVTSDDRTWHIHFPVLSKLLFTDDRLSIQVHPDDAYAITHHGGPGKTEAWYVVAAEPGSQIALGLKKSLTQRGLRRSAESGEIDNYLNWIDVKQGDTYLVSPGTLHALGPGLVICEIQQNSDLTYRVYDYGRHGIDGSPRPLHINHAVTVASLDAHKPLANAPFSFPESARGTKRELLAACRYFAIERVSCINPDYLTPTGNGAELLIVLEGCGQMCSEAIDTEFTISLTGKSCSRSCVDYLPADVFLIPHEVPRLRLHPATPTVAIRTHTPNLKKLAGFLRQSGATKEQLSTLIR